MENDRTKLTKEENIKLKKEIKELKIKNEALLKENDSFINE